MQAVQCTYVDLIIYFFIGHPLQNNLYHIISAAKKRESKKVEEELSQNTQEIPLQTEQIQQLEEKPQIEEISQIEEIKEENPPISSPKNHPILNWAEDSDRNSSSDQSD